MATTKQRPGGAPAKGGPQNKGGEKKAKGAAAKAQYREHPNAGQPAPAPRLRQYYENTVRERLKTELGLDNVHEIPTLKKIVLNVGLGEALKQPKLLDSVVQELEVITGQRPVRTRAKKSISNFGLREGQEIGASVTLRGPRMWEFLDRLFNVAMPRIRDFRGVSRRAFDGRGNYNMGVKEQIIFPEINYDQVDAIRGMDIAITTTAKSDDDGRALLEAFKFPLRGER
jgi:large subunit ribosomal protein L5